MTLSDLYGYNYSSAFDGNLTVNAVGGVATFSGISQTFATAGTYQGESDTLFADGDGLAEATSGDFVVKAGAATQLVFSGAPYDSTNDGQTLANSPLSVQVQAEDRYGNVDTTFNGTITLALKGNPSNATLGGTTTVPAVAGVASFTDITLSKTGDGFTLAASSDSNLSITSDPFYVSTQLVFTTQPPNIATAGSPFTVVVEAETSTGSLDTTFNGAVTLSDEYSYYANGTQNGSPVSLKGSGLSSDQGPAFTNGILSGTLTVNAVNGIATFTGISQNSATGTLYDFADTLYADSSQAYGAQSNALTIAAATATQLVFAGTPTDKNGDGGTVANTPLSVEVRAEDQYGNTDPTFNGSIILTLGVNPTHATLGGTITVTAVNGIADYNDLTISAIGNGYSLIADAQDPIAVP